ncbi:MAG: glutamine synthetase family protein [Oscillospiraceae bacterium]|jgi:glutamine synthetase|nr:glutamine synthetase family protein [Oscillospiraceae bacterium]
MFDISGDVLAQALENDVKFIRLTFCDLFGVPKNIAIMAGELENAFRCGVSFDAHAIRGFRDTARSDLLLLPDPSTFSLLPWRPGSGRVARFYCDIKNPDGSPYAHDSRAILKKAAARCEELGYVCKIGAECEFYLFKTDEHGEPTGTPLDKGGYLDIAPPDKGEDVRREICLTLEETGIYPEASHHEQGPGQNEIDFRFDTALASADNFQTFKSTVAAVAARHGLCASFSPKPLPDAEGSGLHINISLSREGRNVFLHTGEGHCPEAESFIAGVLAAVPQITAFLNPVESSYERLGAFQAPKYVSWSHQNRSQLIRIPAATGEKVRMELRSPDPACNPYLAFALIISAGLRGLENRLPLPPPLDVDMQTANEGVTGTLTRLPATLAEAVALAAGSELVKDVLGDELLGKWVAEKNR